MTIDELLARVNAATGPDRVLDLQILALAVDPDEAGFAINELGWPTELSDHLDVPEYTSNLPRAREIVAGAYRASKAALQAVSELAGSFAGPDCDGSRPRRKPLG